MKYLVVSDIHSNWEALHAVLRDAGKTRYERILCLGDVVGYGANPNECCDFLRKQKNAIVLQGNHDAAVTGQVDPEHFNREARQALAWTRERLSPENREWLSDLPRFFTMKFLLAVHGTPSNPLEEYLDEETAKRDLKAVPEKWVLCGHSHTPFHFFKHRLVPVQGNLDLELRGKRMAACVPSVGQPRDGDPRAGYCILDFARETLQFKRVEYDLRLAAQKIRDAGLPEGLAERLAFGI